MAGIDEVRELTLDAPVTQVTLLEDRALVRRQGRATLTPGLWRVTVENVTPVLADKSLRGEFCGASPGAHLDDLRLRRQMLVKAKDRPESMQELETEVRSLLEDYRHVTQDREHQDYCFNKIEKILAKALEELPEDAAWGQLDPLAWRSQLESLFQQLRSLRGEILTGYRTQEQLHDRINRLIARMQSLSRPDMLYAARLEADLTITQPTDNEIAFEYVVPNALWRPWHQARLTRQETPQISFRMEGCVWQQTGEDWSDVDVIFSTARASLGTEPPLLTEDRLNVKEKSKTLDIEIRDRPVQTVGFGSAATPGTVNLPGVDDGGEVRTLRPPTKASIPSDGRPYRVPIFSFTSEATIEYILIPEIACQVILKSEQTNRASFPILAGPVDLVRESEYVGKTAVAFIAPGEKFALGWGPENALRVQRKQSQKGETDRLTQWHHLTTTTELFLSNIGAEPRTVTTTERVPVSELEEVTVEAIASETTDGIQPDENGFCTWRFTLAPYSQMQAQLVYKVSKSPSVSQR
jgi:uncharacterized protein (TIGR02231 family)